MGNLLLKLPGTFPAPRRLLMAHVDTVPICEGARPRRRGKWIVPADRHTGLGADDRSGTAVVLHTALEILEKRLPHPPLTFLWTVQEEVGLFGARLPGFGIAGKAATGFQFRRGGAGQDHPGSHRRLSHDDPRTRPGQPRRGGTEKGISAIAIAALAIAQLHREGWHGRIDRDGGEGTSNVGVIAGGQATNVVTPEVLVRAEARSHSPAFRRRIVREIQRAFREAAQNVRNHKGNCGRVTCEGSLDYEAFRLAADEPCVRVAEAAVRQTGGTVEHAISNGGLDANWMTAHGIPTVSLGAGQVNPHTTSERLNLAEFFLACRIAQLLATGKT